MQRFLAARYPEMLMKYLFMLKHKGEKCNLTIACAQVLQMYMAGDGLTVEDLDSVCQ